MIFLLGGHGFVGSGYARLLAERGIEHTVITRANYAEHVGKACSLFINANGNSSKIFSRDNPREDFQASVASVRNSLVDFRFDTYVMLSSGDVYPDCSSPATTSEDLAIDYAKQSTYGFHKHLAELCVQHAAKRWLIVRQGGFVGPGLKKNAVFDVLNGDKIWVHPDSRFQFIHTDDSAAACLSLLESGATNAVFNLTANGTISVREVMAMVGRSLDYPADAAPAVYEMTVAKAAGQIAIPDSMACVHKYLAAEGRLG